MFLRKRLCAKQTVSSLDSTFILTCKYFTGGFSDICVNIFVSWTFVSLKVGCEPFIYKLFKQTYNKHVYHLGGHWKFKGWIFAHKKLNNVTEELIESQELSTKRKKTCETSTLTDIFVKVVIKSWIELPSFFFRFLRWYCSARELDS